MSAGDVEGFAIDPAKVRAWKRYPAYKDSGVEWLGEVPVGWDVKRLKNSIELCKNGIWGDEPDGKNDIRCIRVADFNRLILTVNNDNPTYRAVLRNDLNGRIIKRGDLLIEKSGGGEKQAVGTVIYYDSNGEATCSNFIARIAVSKKFSARYLVYLHAYLHAGCINNRSIKQTTGIQNLDTGSYFDEKVAYPPLPEQHAIAAFLDRETARINALIAKKQRFIELLEEKRQALISHAVTKGLDPDAAMKDSGVEWLGMVPVGWEVVPLDKCLSHFFDYRGRTPKKLGMDWGNGSIPAISANNVEMGRLNLDKDVNYGSTELYSKWMTDGDLRCGDVVFTSEAPLGNVAQIPDNNQYILSQRVVLLRGKRDLLENAFLKYYIMASPFQWFLSSQSTGSTAVGIKMSKFKSSPILVPPLPEQRVITAYLDQQTENIDHVNVSTRQQLKKLEELRTALISAAVTGKIDVRSEGGVV